ncbi:MAG: polyphosphate kinase 2 family protein [Polyangiaceae bacterium]
MKPVESPYLVPSDGSFELAASPTEPPKGSGGKDAHKDQLAERVDALGDLQRKLYADDRYALLLVFQAMDAAGKDSTIRKVFSGVNPAGFQVFSFKQPSAVELDHDFLWRSARALPERGRIGVFNRSYYEEVLVVRVHPEYLGGQKLPDIASHEQLWQERYESIRDHEKHLARNGTVVLKFWLNVSRAEQHRRFVDRIDEADKNWKFSAGDVAESRLWDQYMDAYQDALRATSRPWAPWYAIPADSKPFMRATVADIVVRTLEALPLRWPEPSDEDRAEMKALRAELEAKK